jgi:flagellar biogenesis protein FliO
MDKAFFEIAIKMGFALLLALGVFGVSVFLFKKLSSKSKGFLRKSLGAKSKPIEILAYQSLGPGKSVYLIRCLEKKMFIGATSQNINVLSEDIVDIEDVNEEEEVFSSSLKNKMPVAQKSGFVENLGKELKNIARI